MFVIFLHIMFYDVWFYLSHIALHNSQIYYIHKKHHNKLYKSLTFKDGNEGHLVEHLIQKMGLFIPCFIYTFQLNSLLLSILVIEVRSLMRHDYRCCFLIGNHHLLHHKYPKCNFGEYWIDKICGTMCKKQEEYIYGIIYT